MTDHDRLRELAQNATPGPWVARDCGDVCCQWVSPADAPDTDILVGRQDRAVHEFIAAANPATILALLTEIATAKADAWDEAATAAADSKDASAPYSAGRLRRANPYRGAPDDSRP